MSFEPGTPVTLKDARSWHGIVERRRDDGLYDVDFGPGFSELELMLDPEIPHEFVEGQMYGPGQCAYEGCGRCADHEVHDPLRVEIERQRQARDRDVAEETCGDCVEGRCHWGGTQADTAVTAAEAGREYIDPVSGQACGCERHAASVRARSRYA